MSKLPGTSQPANPGWRSGFAGVGLATLGHVLAIAAVVIAARLAGGARGSDVDLDAGGRFAIAYAMLCTYAASQVILLTGAVIFSAYRGPRLKVGLIVGWGGGLALVLGALAVSSNSAS